MSFEEDDIEEWRMDSVDWNPVEMTAHSKARRTGAAKKRHNTRSANLLCQVEGCHVQLLPLRSYYQRQHICEEHFRALVISDASGRVTRFCQQCTKLEPLSNFDGERRSCRVSLERRNQRRQGKRVDARSASRAKSLRPKPAPHATSSPRSTAGVPDSNSSGGASGTGSVTGINGNVPAGFPAQPSLSADEAACGGLAGQFLANGTGWNVACGPTAASAADVHNLPTTAATTSPSSWQSQDLGFASIASSGLQGFWLHPVEASRKTQAQAASDHSASFHEPPFAALPPSVPAIVPQLQQQPPQLALLPDLPPTSHTAALPAAACSAMPEVRVEDMSGGLGTLSTFEMDKLLALDADSLADAILQTSAPPSLPSPIGGTAAVSGLAFPLPSPHQPAAAGKWQQSSNATMGTDLPSILPSTQQHASALQWQQTAAAAAPPAGFAPVPARWAPVDQAPSFVPTQKEQPRAWHQALLHGSSALPSPAMTVPQSAAYQGMPTASMLYAGQLSPAEHLSTPQLLGDLNALGVKDAELDLLLAPDLDEMRACFKLYGVRPEQLPPQLRADIMNALALPNTVMQATVRSGCVHLTLTALLSTEERERLSQPGAAATVLSRLLPLAQQLPSGRIVAQVGTNSAALLAQPSGGRPAVLLSLPPAQLPRVLPASPLATTVSAAAGRFRLRCTRALLMGSAGYSAPPLGLHCRCGGKHVAVSLSQPGAADFEADAGSSDDDYSDEEALQHHDQGAGHATSTPQARASQAGGPDSLEADGAGSGEQEDDKEGAAEAAAIPDAGSIVEVEAWVPAAAHPALNGSSDDTAQGDASSGRCWQAGWGLYEFEVSQGALVGETLPILVLPDSQAAAAVELARMSHSALSVSLLRLVAVVLTYLESREGAAAGAATLAELQQRYPPLALARVAAAARKLLDIAERASWPALASLLLPAATVDGWRPPSAAVQQAAAQTPSTMPVPQAEAFPAAAADAAPQSPHKGTSRMPLSIDKLGAASCSTAGEMEVCGKAASGGKLAAAGVTVPELAMMDADQQRVMHPAVLGAATLMVAGVVMGVGAALVTGHLG